LRGGTLVNKPTKNTATAVITEEMALSSPHWSGCKIVNITECPDAIQFIEKEHNAIVIARKDNFKDFIILIELYFKC